MLKIKQELLDGLAAALESLSPGAGAKAAFSHTGALAGALGGAALGYLTNTNRSEQGR